MPFLCPFTWFPRATTPAPNRPARIRGGYNLVGGAGFFLDAAAAALTAFPQPSMDPMGFDVRAITQLEDAERVGELRRVARRSA